MNTASAMKSTPRALLRTGAKFVGLLALYLAFEWISVVQEYRGLPVTAWNPGLGILFAGMARGSGMATLALFCGALIAESTMIGSSETWREAAALAALITISYACVAALARALRLDPGLERVRDVALLLSAGFAGALLVGSALALFLLAGGLANPLDISRASVPLLVGDMIGIAVVTPLVLRSSRERLRRQLADTSFMAGVLAAAAVAVLSVWLVLREGDPRAYQAFYFLFLPVVFAALRNGLDGVCLTLAATQVALLACLNAYAYDATAFTNFQTLMTVLTATGLLVGAVSSERDAESRAARNARALLKEKESEAARADRFHLVTGLASALSHEINQPMTAARAYARTAQKLSEAQPPDIERVRDYVDRSVQQIDHAAGILRSMREFLRRGDLGRANASAAQIVKDALTLVRPLASQHRIRVVSDVAPDLPQLHCDRVQLQQVLMNLAGNAIEAIASQDADVTRGDGLVSITVGRGEGPDHVEFAVRDNGPGVAPDFASKAFEPLATTKDDGLGLGLAISAGIVEAHGGRIWLHSGEPGATEFRFWIPAAARGQSKGTPGEPA